MRKETGKPVPASIQKEKTWDDFLAFLAKKNGAMYAILKDWKLNLLEKDQVEISGEKHSFSSTYFDDKDRYNQLSAFCGEFFDGNIQVKISFRDNNPVLPSASTAGSSAEADKTEINHLPPPVQDVLKLFQGKIVGEDLKGDK